MEIATKEQLRGVFLRWAVVTVPLILLLGFASSRIAPAGAQNRWYAALVRPGITPPDWVFPVAWSALYILMGLALAMIINARGSRLRGLAIALFVLQLVGQMELRKTINTPSVLHHAKMLLGLTPTSTWQLRCGRRTTLAG